MILRQLKKLYFTEYLFFSNLWQFNNFWNSFEDLKLDLDNDQKY